MSTSAAGESGPPRGRRTLWMSVLAALLVAIAAYGVVARDRLATGDPGSPSSPGDLIRAAQARDTSLAAIGRVTGLPEPCTAWLVDVGAAGDTPAYALTAGRCVGIEDTSTVITGQPATGAAIAFSTFAPTSVAGAPSPVEVPVRAVAWASMRGTDLAVLELGATYPELAARGVAPIEVAAPLASGGQVLLAGVPVRGVPGDAVHLRGTRCTVGGSVQLLEAPWLWPVLQSSDCRGFLGGSEGSPALDSAGRAVGMGATSTIGAEEGRDCYPGRPCEVSRETLEVVADRTYLVAVDGLAGCFPGGSFRLGEGCSLESPAGVVVASAQPTVARPGSQVRILVPEQRPGSGVAVLVGKVGQVGCGEAAGWTPELVVGGGVTVMMPPIQGFALACVGSPGQPTPLVIEADAAAPDSGSLGLEQSRVEAGVEIRPTSDSPDITGFLWVGGPLGSTDCASTEGYVAYPGRPAVVEVADLPMTVCVIGVDVAGNRTAPESFEVTLPGE